MLKYRWKKEVVEQPSLWQKQILPHLSLFCPKASHRYDLLLSVWKLKMRISKLEVRELCQSLTLYSHLNWTCENWIWSIWVAHATPLSCLSFGLLLFFYHIFAIWCFSSAMTLCLSFSLPFPLNLLFSSNGVGITWQCLKSFCTLSAHIFLLLFFVV